MIALAAGLGAGAGEGWAQGDDGADVDSGAVVALLVPDPAVGGVVTLELMGGFASAPEAVVFALAPVARAPGSGARAVALRGVAVGRGDLWAAGGVVEGALHLVVVSDGGERWVVEPVEGGVGPGTEGARAHRVRLAAPVPASAGLWCSTSSDGPGLSVGSEDPGVETTGAAPGMGLRGVPVRVAELACDADAEFVAWRGSAQAASDWMSVLVAVADLAFFRDAGITHQIASVRMRTQEPDPYTTREPAGMLAELRAQWTGSGADAGSPRDLALLFTGKDPVGLSVGQAAQIGAVCGDGAMAFVAPAYALDLATQADLVAHELGHVWGACHCACSYPASTMNPYIIGALRFGLSAPGECGATGGSGGTTSSAAIIAHRDSRTCLEPATIPPPCAADFNRTGGITVQDIYDFLQVWSVRLAPGDFNGNGAVTAQDLYDFLTAWATGCP